MSADTSIEAVERLAAFHALSVDRYDADEESGLRACAAMTAATLRALAQERDDEKVRADTNADAHAAAMRSVRLVEAERDAARVEVARLREAIKDALGDLSEHAEPYGRAAIESAHKKLRAVWLASTEEQQ